MKNLYEKMKWFLHLYRREYALSVSLILVNYVTSLIPLRLVGHISDRIVAKSITLNELIWLFVLMIVLTVGGYVVGYIWQVYLFKAADVIGYEARRRLVAKYLAQAPPFFQRHSTGSLMGKATNDVSALEALAGFGVMSLVDSTIYPITLLVIMATSISWQLTLFSIVPLPLLIVFSTKVGAVYNRKWDEAQQAFDKMNDRVLENVAGVRVLRAYVQEEAEEKTFSNSAETLYEKNMDVAKLEALFPAISRVIPALSYVIAVLIGALYISRGQMTSGQLVSFIIYLNMLTWPMLALGEFINVAEQGASSMERIDELLHYKEDIVDKKEAIAYEGGGDITFQKVSFSYPDIKEKALAEIDFHLKHGQTLGLVGPIGSGKTTILKQLLRFYPIKDASVLLGGRPIEDYDVDSVRKAIGYVPQQHVLFSRSIEDNILMGKQEEGAMTVEEAVALEEPQIDAGLGGHLLQIRRLEFGVAAGRGEEQLDVAAGERLVAERGHGFGQVAAQDLVQRAELTGVPEGDVRGRGGEPIHQAGAQGVHQFRVVGGQLIVAELAGRGRPTEDARHAGVALGGGAASGLVSSAEHGANLAAVFDILGEMTLRRERSGTRRGSTAPTTARPPPGRSPRSGPCPSNSTKSANSSAKPLRSPICRRRSCSRCPAA